MIPRSKEDERPSRQLSTDEVVIDLEAKSGKLKQKLTENISSAISRNDDLDDLTETAATIHGGAQTFEKAGKKLKRQKYIEMAKARAMCIILVMLLVLIMAFFLYNMIWGKSSGTSDGGGAASGGATAASEP